MNLQFQLSACHTMQFADGASYNEHQLNFDWAFLSENYVSISDFHRISPPKRLNPIRCGGGGSARTPLQRYQPSFCGGCTNQFQMSNIFAHNKNVFLTKMVKSIFFSQFFLFQICNQYALRKILRCITYLRSKMLKIQSTPFKLLILCNLKAAP